MGIIQMRLIWPTVCNSSLGEFNSSLQFQLPGLYKLCMAVPLNCAEVVGASQKNLFNSRYQSLRFLIKEVHHLASDNCID